MMSLRKTRARILWVTLFGLLALAAASATELRAAALAEEIERNQHLAAIWRQEQLISQCMDDRGFEYVAWVDPYEDPAVEPPSQAERDLFADNPNDALVAEMSLEEHVAYEEALWGPRADRVGDVSSLNGGCISRAFEEVYGETPSIAVATQREALQKVSSSVSEDPRMAEAETDWMACMQAAGYEVTGRRTFLDEIWQEEDELVREAILQGVEPSTLKAWEPFEARKADALAEDALCADEYLWPVEELVTAEHVDAHWPSDG